MQGDNINRQLDRMEERLQTIDDRTRAIELHIAEQRGVTKGEGRAMRLVKAAVMALIGAAAGMGGGNIKLPGLH